MDRWPEHIVLKYTLDIPEATPSNNVIKGMHFQTYKTLRRRWQVAVFVAINGRRPKIPLDQAFLVVTRECAGEGLDWDNAYGGLKPLLDCLVVASEKNPDGLGLIKDDSPKHMPYPPFVKQLPAKKKSSRTRVEIFEIIL